MNKKFFCCVFCCMFSASAKDYGIQGKTFEIEEENILTSIKNSISKIDIDKFQKNIKEQAVKSINRPKSISLPRALENRKIIFDPSMILSSDLKDHTGKIFAIKGQKFNPLKFTNLKEALIFINGDDKEQVEYALLFQGLKQIILTKGEPLNLNKRHKQIFYFDFEGGLTKRFGIQKLPSVVVQKGEVLEINEIAL